MNFSVLPALLIFRLDYTLWPFYADLIDFPCTRKNTFIFDKKDIIINCYNEVHAIFKKLQNFDLKIAVLECVNSTIINDVTQLINMFGWSRYITYTQLGPEDELDQIKKLLEKSNITSDKILVCNGPDTHVDINPKKDFFVRYTLYRDEGMRLEDVDDALNKYEKTTLYRNMTALDYIKQNNISL